MEKQFWILMTAIVFLTIGCSMSKKNDGKESPFEVDARVDSLMKLMTLSDKVGQLVIYSGNKDTAVSGLNPQDTELIRKGKIGNIYNLSSLKAIAKLQKIAVEESPRKIPLLVAYDLPHGYKTIFPLSIAQASSWDMNIIENSARITALEATTSGINWTFSPMCNLTIDPRWDMVPQGAGEDPFLVSSVVKAQIKGFQGKNNSLASPYTILACIKHFVAFGAPYSGRNCNLIDMSQHMLLDYFLAPYEAGIQQGALSVMASSNDLNFIPVTANRSLLTVLLRQQLGFEGLIVSAENGIPEIVNHGTAPNDSVATIQALKAGINMDMQGGVYDKYLIKLVKDGIVNETLIDESCRHILRIKFKLGLFDNPYKNMNGTVEEKGSYNISRLDAAYNAAVRSFVLLKNEGNALPLIEGEKLIIIGNAAIDKTKLFGPDKTKKDTAFISSILEELENFNGKKNVKYMDEALFISHKKQTSSQDLIRSTSHADKIIYIVGEDCFSSRTSLSIPASQRNVLENLSQLKKPVILLLMNERPLAITNENSLATSVLDIWYPGAMGAKAVSDVLFGEYNPSGKLPMTFPRYPTQVPVFYWEKSLVEQNIINKNADPCDSVNTPLYKFGHGLSYTQFAYSNLELSSTLMTPAKNITATVTVTNTGKRDGEEIVQVYYHDLVASMTRPKRLLCAFEKVLIKAGESKQISFMLKPEMFAFHNQQMYYGPEPGEFDIYVGGSLDSTLKKRFTFK